MTDQAVFPGDPVCVRSARHFARGALARVGLTAEQRMVAELLVSELVTNAVRHAATAFAVGITARPERIRIEVTDTGAGSPVRRDPAADQGGGRGLHIVANMADEWGVTRRDRSKTVWCSISARSPVPFSP